MVYMKMSSANEAPLVQAQQAVTAALHQADAAASAAEAAYHEAAQAAFNIRLQYNNANQAVNHERNLAPIRREINRIKGEYNLGEVKWEQNAQINAGNWPPDLYARIADGECHLSNDGLLTLLKNAMNGNFQGIMAYGGLKVPWRVWAYWFMIFQAGIPQYSNPSPETLQTFIEFFVQVRRKS